jgi:hypothetical protein
MCEYVDSASFLPGWACCTCKRAAAVATYNGMHRIVCKQCDKARCPVLSVDRFSGRRFTDRVHHRV